MAPPSALTCRWPSAASRPRSPCRQAVGQPAPVLASGSLRCWGDNGAGQIGDGTTVSRLVPTAVTGISTATGVSAGFFVTCAVLSSGAGRCWGSGGNGRLGNGSESGSLVPVAVTGLTSAAAISVGGNHTCAVTSGGTAKCWGYGYQGQLGIGVLDSPDGAGGSARPEHRQARPGAQLLVLRRAVRWRHAVLGQQPTRSARRQERAGHIRLVRRERPRHGDGRGCRWGPDMCAPVDRRSEVLGSRTSSDSWATARRHQRALPLPCPGSPRLWRSRVVGTTRAH